MGIFSSDPEGRPFELFGPTHLRALAVTGAGIAGTVLAGRRLCPAGRRRGRKLLVGALYAQEVAYHLWKAGAGSWNCREMLPLHLCSTLVWVSGPVLLTPTRLGDDLAWYWGLAGAPQALLTPDLAGYGYPHFRFWQFFTSHGLIVLVPLWQAFVEGRRPSRAGAAPTFALLLAHAGLAHAVNRRLGSNYMFVSRKPETASVLDHLPPWPQYIPVLMAVGVVVFGALGAPFVQPDAQGARRPRRR